MVNLGNKFRGKKVLITGGTGFLGKTLVPELKRQGALCTTFGSNFDLRERYQTEIVFDVVERYDYIIHAAVLQGASDWPLHHKADQFDANVRIHTNVLSSWYKFQPQAKMIGIGSSCSYPANKSILSEEDYWDGRLHESVDVYGMTKRVMTTGIDAYKSQHGLIGTTVIFATLYGEHDCFDLDKAHVVSALIRKFIEATDECFPTVEVWGDGTQTRELIHVADQVAGLLTVIDYNGDVINIGTGESNTIRELAETIKDVVGFKGEIRYNPNKFTGVKHKVLNIDLAKRLYGWTTDIKIGTLVEGITNTVKWYRDAKR